MPIYNSLAYWLVLLHAALDSGTHGVGASTIASLLDLATHAGLPTVHQDAPNLIAIHAALPNVHHTPPGGTFEMFTPAQQKQSGGTLDWIGCIISAAGKDCFMRMLVPQDFTSISDIEVILTPAETGAGMHFTITTRYGAYNGGEAYNVHTETDAARDIGATVDSQHKAHSISDLVDIAALVAGDLLTVQVIYDATPVNSNARIQGLRFKYA